MASDRRFSPGEKFRIRTSGKEHVAGDVDCAGCAVLNGIRYPHSHWEGPTMKHFAFLVHGEMFDGVIVRRCEDCGEMASLKIPGREIRTV